MADRNDNHEIEPPWSFQMVEDIAHRVLEGKCPDGKELVILARGALDAIARERHTKDVIIRTFDGMARGMFDGKARRIFP